MTMEGGSEGARNPLEGMAEVEVRLHGFRLEAKGADGKWISFDDLPDKLMNEYLHQDLERKRGKKQPEDIKSKSSFPLFKFEGDAANDEMSAVDQAEPEQRPQPLTPEQKQKVEEDRNATKRELAGEFPSEQVPGTKQHAWYDEVKELVYVVDGSGKKLSIAPNGIYSFYAGHNKPSVRKQWLGPGKVWKDAEPAGISPVDAGSKPKKKKEVLTPKAMVDAADAHAAGAGPDDRELFEKSKLRTAATDSTRGGRPAASAAPARPRPSPPPAAATPTTGTIPPSVQQRPAPVRNTIARRPSRSYNTDMSFEGNMGGMYRMREAQKNMREQILHPVTGDAMDLGEHDRTLDQIFQDEQEQKLFLNRFLYSEDKHKAEEVARALAEHTPLTPQQDAFLEKKRGEYNLRRAEVEKVREMLTPEEMRHIANADPRIQQIIGKIGPDKAAEFFGEEFEKLAMSDVKSFRRVVDNMRHVQEMRTGWPAARIMKEVQDGLRAHGISEKRYWEATKSGLRTESESNLQKLVAKDYGWFRRSIDFISSHKLSGNAAKSLYDTYEKQQRFLAECDTHLNAVGRVLLGTLDPDARLAMQKVMMEGGEIGERRAPDNQKTIQDYWQMKAEYTPGAIKSRWETYKAEELRRNPAATHEFVQDSFIDREFNQRHETAKRTSGVIAILLAFFFGSQTKDDIKKLLTF